MPHIGWSEVELVAPSPLTVGLPAAAFYHVHSLAVRPESPQDVVGVSEYGERFATIVARGSASGCNFTPRSPAAGLALLERFVGLCDGHATRPSTPLTGAARQ